MATILICSLFIFIGASVKDLLEMREEQPQRVVNPTITFESTLFKGSADGAEVKKVLSLCCIISGATSEKESLSPGCRIYDSIGGDGGISAEQNPKC